jgi:colanic acid/amylovoran biosynthesis glycosyltransferase
MVEHLKVLGCPAERITIVPLAVDTRRFIFTERKPLGRGKPVRLLTVGRLVPKKGVDILLQALAILKPHHFVQLWIAGDGPQRPELERLADELDLRDIVTFLGWVEHSQITELMAQADLFVLASRIDLATGETEGSPTVLLEAQAMGLPVISTFHGDIPFIVQHGETGILVPEGNVEALAGALDELLRRPERWADMGRAGRVLMESRHDVHRVGARLERVYDECLF